MNEFFLMHKSIQNNLIHPLNLSLRTTVKYLPQISAFCAIIGFVNIWIYLGRIDQLPLLPSVLASPSTLLAIFASMSLIITLWSILIIFPAAVLAWYVKNIGGDKRINHFITHSLILSIIIAVAGVNDSSLTPPIATYYAMIYACHICIKQCKNKTKESIQNILGALFFNIPLFMIFLFIYNKSSLSEVDRTVRLITLLSYLFAIYTPILSISIHFKNKKIIDIKSIIAVLLSTFIILFPITYYFNKGLLFKFNDYTMVLSGLRSTELQSFKVDSASFPTGWLDSNWGVGSTNDSQLWLKGYPLFQNNEIILTCPEETMREMNKYIVANSTLHNNLHKGSMSSMRCIFIRKKEEYYKIRMMD